MQKISLTKSFIALVTVISVNFFVVSQSIARALPDFTELVEENASAVVNISTSQKVKTNKFYQQMPDLGPGMDELPDIFKHFFGMPGQPRGGERHSLGSGFLISADGYLLTNHHVIKGADEIIVRLSDRRELEAAVIGVDPRSDLALLKIEATGLPSVEIGSSKKLKVGEWVLAIGSPFGFDHSVTAGIVSATGRNLPSDNYVPFIQTDVAINPGNSGGPLFNLEGEVIGINSQIYTRSGGFMGVSFAIPIDVAMEVAGQLKESGTVSRGWLGVLIQDVSRDLAESFGLDKPQGALVAQIMPDSPAADSDLKEGDIIIEFDGDDVVFSSDLPHLVGRVNAGTKVKLKVVRAGKEQMVSLVIGALPDEENLQAKRKTAPSSKANRLGLIVEPLSQLARKKWDVEQGVGVKQVFDGPAATAGLRKGDVITMLNNEWITSVDQFNTVTEGMPVNKPVPMRIVRRGTPSFLPIRITE